MSVRRALRLRRLLSSSNTAKDDASRLRDIEKLMLPSPTAPTGAVLPRSSSAATSVRPGSFWVDVLKERVHPHPVTIKLDFSPRRMEDSYVQVDMELTKDAPLLEQYVNVWGELRMGKILEDLDAIAGSIAYKHVIGPDDPEGQMTSPAASPAPRPLSSIASPVTIVTASLDKLQILRPFLSVTDLRLSGHVSYVGTSSMEVYVKLEDLAPSDNENNTILLARFTMAARDKETGKAAKIAPLILETDEQRALYKMAEEQKQRKKNDAAMDLEKSPPTSEEAAMMHQAHTEARKYDHSAVPAAGSYTTRKAEGSVDVVWMADTVLSSCTIMQPQYRNIHNKIFGGYLLRMSYELAFANASSFIHGKPLFIALDQVQFKRPVPIGSILLLTSKILYSYGPPSSTFQVGVEAELFDVREGKRGETTNVFYFTFASKTRQDPSSAVIPLRRVLPQTYDETLDWVEAYRRRELGKKLAKQYKAMS